MDYLALQKMVIADYKIIIRDNSLCWERMHAHTDGTRRICKWKPVNSYNCLFDLLHEIGHIETDKKGMKRCEQESEATRWCLGQLRELGLPIKRKYADKFKKYIKMTYDRGIRRGLSKRIKSKLYI